VRGLVCGGCNRRLIAVDAGTPADELTARYLALSTVPVPTPVRRLLTAREAAERLSVSVRTLSRWGEAGTLPTHRTLGGHRRYDPDDIDRLIEAPPPQPTELPPLH